MVFQNYALFPHLSARRNVAFGLEIRRVPVAERNRRVQQLLERVGLTAEEYERMPAALSGGQQQRVALARALAIEPDVLLLDEPLANLDRHLRDQLRAELRNLQKETGVTTVMVTHDQEEALGVSDQIGVMAAGRILQLGTGAELYDRPRSSFVAKFLGAANLFEGKVLGQSSPLVMVRPEHCLLNPASASCPWLWGARVLGVTFLGADVLAQLHCDNGTSLQIRARASETLAPGQQVTVGIPEHRIWPLED